MKNSCAIHVVNNMYCTLFEIRDIDIISRRDIFENWSPIAPDVLL